MELASVEPLCGSVPVKAVDLSASVSHHSAHEKRAESEMAFGPLVEERPSQTSTEQSQSESEQLSSSEDSSSEDSSSEDSSSRGDSLRCLSFLKKLWDVTESDLFESIWWGDKKKSIVIDEDLFGEEVLKRRGSMKIFGSETMESFAQDLRKHGFYRKLQGFPNSGVAGPAVGEIHFRCTKYFQLFPHLLRKYEKVLVPKTQTLLGSSPAMELSPSSRKRKADHQLVWETTYEEESSSSFSTALQGDSHPSTPRATSPAMPSAKIPKTDAPPLCQISTLQQHPAGSSSLL